MKNAIIAIALAGTAALGAATLPAQAADVRIGVDIGAPPPPRYEVVPAPRAGYVWSPGYWDWRDGRHDWRAGYRVRERPGHAYAAPAWVQENDRWVLRRGGWGDRDRDGIPNRYDRHPNNWRRG